MTRIHIVQDPEHPKSVGVMAEAIIAISDGFKKLTDAGLSERGLVVLLQDSIGAAKITKDQIRLVIDALPRLKSWYVKK